MLASIYLLRNGFVPRSKSLMMEKGLILTTSIFALPLALAAFPQRQAVQARSLEEFFWDIGGKDGKVEFNRGI